MTFKAQYRIDPRAWRFLGLVTLCIPIAAIIARGYPHGLAILGLSVVGGFFLFFPEGLAWLMLFSIFFYPFPFVLPGFILYPFELISCLLLVAAFCRAVANPDVNRLNLDTIAVSLMALTVVCIVSMSYSVDARNGFRVMRGLCLDPLLVYLAFTSNRASCNPRRVYSLFLILGITIAALGLYQYFHPTLQFLRAYMEESVTPNMFLLGGAVRITSVFSNPAILGETLILVFLPLMHKLVTTRGIAGLVVLGGALTVLAAIGATFTRAAWVGVAAGLAYYVFRGRGRKGLSVIVATTMAAALAVCVVPAQLLVLRFQYDNSMSMRIEILETLCRKVILQHPFLGEGIGAMPVNFPTSVEGIPLYHAHNILLHVQAELGIVGLAIFLLILSRVAWLFSVRRLNLPFPGDTMTPGVDAGCAGYLVASMFDAGPFLYVRASLLFWILISLVFMEGRTSGKGTDFAGAAHRGPPPASSSR